MGLIRKLYRWPLFALMVLIGIILTLIFALVVGIGCDDCADVAVEPAPSAAPEG